jgi:four helix bundle protein
MRKGHRMAFARRFKELEVWQAAMDLAMEIFFVSKDFPPEERYALTDQARRSLRSVAANISEAWRKRRYPAAFVSKLSDAETEAAETQTWVEVALRCQYIRQNTADELETRYEKVISQIVRMIDDADRWTISP